MRRWESGTLCVHCLAPLSGAGPRHSPLSIIYPNVISRSPQWLADALWPDLNTAPSAMKRELGTGFSRRRSPNIINKIRTRELALNGGNFSLKCMCVSFPLCALWNSVNKWRCYVHGTKGICWKLSAPTSVTIRAFRVEDPFPARVRSEK